MHRIPLSLLLIVAASATCAAARLEPQPPGPLPICAVEVEFRVRRTEIDMKTLDRVLAYVENSPAILHAYDATRRGDEPPTLCLVIASESEALTVFEQLTVLIPPNRGRLPKIKPPPPVVLRFNGGK